MQTVHRLLRRSNCGPLSETTVLGMPYLAEIDFVWLMTKLADSPVNLAILIINRYVALSHSNKSVPIFRHGIDWAMVMG